MDEKTNIQTKLWHDPIYKNVYVCLSLCVTVYVSVIVHGCEWIHV